MSSDGVASPTRSDARGKPDVTLVMPSYRRPERLGPLLAAVGRLDPQPAEVIVVAGDGQTAEVAAALGVRVVEVANRNAAASRNAGWRASAGSLVAFLDDDCKPPPAWVRMLADAMARTGAAAVGGPVSNPFPDRRLARVAQTWLDRRLAIGDAEWLPSQNLAVRRHSLDAVGGFDEDLDAYEDVDLSRRLRAAGGRLVYEPGMVVEHEHRLDLRGLMAQHRGYGRGFVQLARKEPGWEQAARAPVSPAGWTRAVSLAIARPVRCAMEMPATSDRLLTLPAFYCREAAFLLGAASEARRTASC